MPFTIKADPEGRGIAIMGLVSPDELPAFQEAFGQAFRQLQGGKPANWHPLFMRLMMTIGSENSQKVNLIKLWRIVSRADLKDAKDYIEAIEAGRAPMPTGFEHPDVNPDELRYFMDRLPPDQTRGVGNWRSLFVDSIVLAQRYTPNVADNAAGVPDPHGFKVLAIKMWRIIAKATFTDAKAYVELLILGNRDWPEGNEHADVDDASMEVFGNDFQRAREMAQF